MFWGDDGTARSPPSQSWRVIFPPVFCYEVSQCVYFIYAESPCYIVAIDECVRVHFHNQSQAASAREAFWACVNFTR
jgi:hypothetical protein